MTRRKPRPEDIEPTLAALERMLATGDREGAYLAFDMVAAAVRHYGSSEQRTRLIIAEAEAKHDDPGLPKPSQPLSLGFKH